MSLLFHLPNCHFSDVTKFLLPNCHFFVVTNLSLPNCHFCELTKLSPYQIVSLPNCNYRIVITKLSLPNCHYQIDITENPPILANIENYTVSYAAVQAHRIVKNQTCQYRDLYRFLYCCPYSQNYLPKIRLAKS